MYIHGQYQWFLYLYGILDWSFSLLVIFKIIRVRIIDTFSFRKSEETHLAPLTHLAKHAILAKFSGLNLKSGSQLLALLHIIG